MCPLRFILVFFSAILAGYFAWRTVRSSPEVSESDDSGEIRGEIKEQKEFHCKRIIHQGFWLFVDMASGRYLWRNMRDAKKDEAATKSS